MILEDAIRLDVTKEGARSNRRQNATRGHALHASNASQVSFAGHTFLDEPQS
jgi:hypothetical protein